jgi:putative glutamine amidotransferase
MKLKCSSFLFLAFIVLIASSGNSCKSKLSSKDSLRIAFSKASGSDSYQNYIRWIKQFDNTVSCIDMIGKTPEEAVKSLESCSGLILTGGRDVDPARYGRINDTGRCETDRKRDTLEIALIKKAIVMKIPVIAICRGEQIFNVAMGGSLIVDIPSDHDTLIHHQTKDQEYIKHYVSLIPGTFMNDLCKTNGDSIISNHHQAVNRLADCFKVAAWAEDSIIEAYGWKDPQGKQFLVAVQWHPERLDTTSKLSTPIAKNFLAEARNYKKKKQK